MCWKWLMLWVWSLAHGSQTLYSRYSLSRKLKLPDISHDAIVNGQACWFSNYVSALLTYRPCYARLVCVGYGERLVCRPLVVSECITGGLRNMSFYIFVLFKLFKHFQTLQIYCFFIAIFQHHTSGRREKSTTVENKSFKCLNEKIILSSVQ